MAEEEVKRALQVLDRYGYTHEVHRHRMRRALRCRELTACLLFLPKQGRNWPGVDVNHHTLRINDLGNWINTEARSAPNSYRALARLGVLLGKFLNVNPRGIYWRTNSNDQATLMLHVLQETDGRITFTMLVPPELERGLVLNHPGSHWKWRTNLALAHATLETMAAQVHHWPNPLQACPQWLIDRLETAVLLPKEPPPKPVLVPGEVTHFVPDRSQIHSSEDFHHLLCDVDLEAFPAIHYTDDPARVTCNQCLDEMQGIMTDPGPDVIHYVRDSMDLPRSGTHIPVECGDQVIREARALYTDEITQVTCQACTERIAEFLHLARVLYEEGEVVTAECGARLVAPNGMAETVRQVTCPACIRSERRRRQFGNGRFA